jgi:hypothetical protein
MNKLLCPEICRGETIVRSSLFAFGALFGVVIGVSLLIPKDVFIVPELWNFTRYQIIMTSGVIASSITFFLARWIRCRHCQEQS